MRPDPFEVKPFPSLGKFKAPSGKTERLRVCIATEEIYGPIRNGGIASTYYHLARTLRNNGHDVTVLYLKSNKSENGPIEDWVGYYQQLGINFVPLPLVAVEGASNWQQRLFSAYVWLKNQAEPFDIVHASEWRGGIYYALLAKHQGIAFDHTLFVIKASSPHIWNRHYMMEFMHNMGLFAIMYPEQMSIELADMVIGGSAHLLRFMEHVGYQLPDKRTYVQPNVLQFDSTDILDKRDKVEPGDIVHTKELVFFGRLEARKGLEIFCDALDFLVARGVMPERVVFMGKEAGNLPSYPDLTNKTYIMMRAENWPFPYQIEDGFHQPEALIFLMEKPRVAVMPSLIENSSMAVYEALMYRIPFIATAVGGTPELVAEQDRSRMLSNANPRDLANALEEVLINGALVGNCSFDNDENLATWQTFHEHLAGLKARKTLDTLRAPRGDGPEPRLSLCVYSDGDAEVLEAFLDRALFNGGGDLFEIVVAATARNADLEAVIAETEGNIRMVEAHEMSLGEAYNAAANLTSGDAFLFLRCDIHTPLTGFATKLRTAFAVSGADALSCIWSRRESKSADSKMVVPVGADLAMAIINKDNLSGRGVAVTGEMFRQLGGFNPIFGMAGIEQDLLMRAANAGAVEIVPEPLYLEDTSGSNLHLNEHNAQYMVNSSLIDGVSYFMKRAFLVLGFLANAQKEGADKPGAAVNPIAISSSVGFVNHSPVPPGGYDKIPALRVKFDETKGEFEIALRNRRSARTLVIELDGQEVTGLALTRQRNGELAGRWSLHSVRNDLDKGPAVLRISIVGEPRGPYRLIRLVPLSSERVAIVSAHNYIETADLAESGHGANGQAVVLDPVAPVRKLASRTLKLVRGRGRDGRRPGTNGR